MAEGFGGRPGPQQIQHGRVVQARAEDTLQCRVDLGRQAWDPVRCRGGMFGRVVVEAAEHGQFGELFVGDLDGPQCVGHGPGRFGDDERVPGVGFRFAGVLVRDPAHRQPGKVSDGDTGGLGDRDGECTDRGWLVNDQQNAAALLGS